MYKYSAIFISIILVLFVQFIYRTNVKAISILIPFVILLLFVSRTQLRLNFLKINKIDLCCYLLIILGLLWTPHLYYFGQSSVSLYKDNHLFSTSINLLPYVACILSFLTTSKIYEKTTFTGNTNFYLNALIIALSTFLITFILLVGKKSFVNYFNSNWIAIGLYQTYVFKLIVSKKSNFYTNAIIFILLLFITVVFLESRSVAGAYIIFIFTIIYINIFKSRSIFIRPVFPLALIISILFTFTISYFINKELNQDLLWFASKHGKNALNGREVAWSDMWVVFQDYFWIGRGTGFLTVSTSISSDFNAAVHNAWLDFGVKHGITGVVLLFVFLCIIGNEFSNNISDKKIIIVKSYLISCIIFITFYNNFGYSHFGMQLITWLIIGYGLGRCNMLKKTFILKNI